MEEKTPNPTEIILDVGFMPIYHLSYNSNLLCFSFSATSHSGPLWWWYVARKTGHISDGVSNSAFTMPVQGGQQCLPHCGSPKEL